MSEARLIVHEDGETKELQLAVGQSILDAALKQGVELDHACGGVCACSTCHVKVKLGFDCFPEASDEELDQLDEARDVGLDSRLACQAKLERVPDGGTVEVVVPSWNVNIVKEGH
ncbi:MAG: 2Fe-2S iron-sulfur cluster-binding protein [Planctomycetota bacterium]|nr:2Fe-2S iron-sulfur cluster-binding protein [Planctomycetota bacterium]MEC8251600.1 2Fe-2S iron-sulfur cluster-binding protein [Planctomycetota bacterium]MEC8651115.1 2Fe-2S iron-sulfur cluster-binding protein [Planctomycetota bacterium]MEC9048154.1 2Fe-2S iron-sulfur cluster-binding protein [Planctomycetota bacterium]